MNKPGEEKEFEFKSAVDRLIKGAIDLHCHSGPSVMPRYF
jgi:hypothetical protein